MSLAYYARRYAQMFLGTSYFHKAQGLGPRLSATSLSGYYNDLRHKREWVGIVDAAGIPMDRGASGLIYYYPITIAQYGLGHFEQYLLDQSDASRQAIRDVADWLVKWQDENGGWPCNADFRPYGLQAPWYSAMAQGEGISFLVRAAELYDRPEVFRDAANRAVGFLVRPVHRGGVAIYEDGGLWLEEYPGATPSHVLNGWVFALFGMWDAFLAFGDRQLEQAFITSYKTLLKNLSKYDTGSWSYYDLGHKLASPFYHDLHVHLLEALYLITGERGFAEVAGRWSCYYRDPLLRGRAIMAKSSQKWSEIAAARLKV